MHTAYKLNHTVQCPFDPQKKEKNEIHLIFWKIKEVFYNFKLKKPEIFEIFVPL